MNFLKHLTVSFTLICLNFLLTGCGGSSYESGNIPRVNKAPVAVADTISVDEDQTIFFDLTANDTDGDSDQLTAVILSNPQNGFILANGNRHSYQPELNFNGVDSFTYEVSDGFGGFSTSTATINVNAVNDDPQANDDTDTTDEDTEIIIDVVSNDEDIDKAESFINSLFAGDIDHNLVSEIKKWAEEVADEWKDFNLYPPEYPNQQDWDMLPSPHKINWKSFS